MTPAIKTGVLSSNGGGMATNDDSGWGVWLLIAAAGLGIYSCSHKSPEAKASAEQAVVAGDAPAPSGLDSVAAAVNPVRGDFNEDRAGEAARDYLSGETYEGAVGSADCTDDCSGHEAGWQWAKDGNDCGNGDSDSFNAGCQAYADAAEERVKEARTRYSDGDDAFAGDE